jgi:hypothetical protein
MRTALLLNAGMLVGCVGAAWIVLPATGILGAGICWTASQTAGAAWAIARWRRIVNGGRPVQSAIAEATAADVLPVVVEGADH